MRAKQNRSSWMIVGAVAAVAGGVVWAQSGGQKEGTGPAAPEETKQTVAPAVEVSEAASRKPLSYYTGGIRATLFSSAPGTPAAPVTKPIAPPVVPALPAVPEKIDPFNDYAYSGTVTMDGESVALVENSKTREGLFLKKGETFLGGTVGEITDRSLKVTIAGVERMMAKTDNFKLTPLDKSAAYLTPAAPGAPGGAPGAMPPGMPGLGGVTPAPGAMMGFQGMGGGGDFMNRMRQRFESMTPEQREEARNRFMNRSFERGSDGGRRRGGGFGF